MIDYETFAKIHDCRDRQGLTIAQTAGTSRQRTVTTWGARSRWNAARSAARQCAGSHAEHARLLDTIPIALSNLPASARGRLPAIVTILRDYVHRIPTSGRSIKLHFATGECAQVDLWGLNRRGQCPSPTFFRHGAGIQPPNVLKFTVCDHGAFLASPNMPSAFGGVPAKLWSTIRRRFCSAYAVRTGVQSALSGLCPPHGTLEAYNVARGNEGRVGQAWATSRRISCTGSS